MENTSMSENQNENECADGAETQVPTTNQRGRAKGSVTAAQKESMQNGRIAAGKRKAAAIKVIEKNDAFTKASTWRNVDPTITAAIIDAATEGGAKAQDKQDAARAVAQSRINAIDAERAQLVADLG
jgi:hypothetical protein